MSLNIYENINPLTLNRKFLQTNFLQMKNGQWDGPTQEFVWAERFASSAPFARLLRLSRELYATAHQFAYVLTRSSAVGWAKPLSPCLSRIMSINWIFWRYGYFFLI